MTAFDFRAPRSRDSKPPQSAPAARWRLWFVAAVLCAGVGGVAWKAGRLQLLLGTDLRGLAEEQYLRKVTVTAPRGRILDDAGKPLAVSVPAYSIFAEPRRIVDKEQTAARLAAALALPVNGVLDKIAVDRAFTWVQRRVGPDVAEAVRALDLPGVGLRKEWRRTWPNKQLAAQVLGGVDVDGAGRGGIEQALDERLAGKSVKVDAIADNKGDRIAQVDGLDISLLDGDDVTLTIDSALQETLEETLQETLEHTHARSVWSVVLDVETGAIRALGQAPGFNPNSGEGERRNEVLSAAFEPGSTFKMATFAASLEAGVVTPTDMIFCENGRFQLGKHVIHDSHKAGWLTARDVFAQSSNIGTLKIAQKLGEERFKESIARFGFGKRPGTGLVEETRGRLPSAAHWGDARLATVSFGHGVLVSALQMTSFVQALGNGGVRKQPWIINSVVGADGEVVEQHGDPEGERIVSPQTAETMLSIMESVTEDGGTGVLAAIPGIQVAGKTGTAEKVDPSTGRYSKTLHLSSFVGLAPRDHPRYAAIVVVDEPRGTVFGGLVAAPAWRRIMQKALLDEGRVGTASLEPTPDELARAHKAMERLAKLDKLEEKTSPVEDLGAETHRSDNDGQAASDDVQARRVPDLRGASARRAARLAEQAGLAIRLAGSGIVVEQTPAAGAPMPDDGVVLLALADAATTLTSSTTRGPK